MSTTTLRHSGGLPLVRPSMESIRRRMKARDWSDADLAYVMGAKHNTINQLMARHSRGESTHMTVYTLGRIACALGCHYYELLEGLGIYDASRDVGKNEIRLEVHR